MSDFTYSRQKIISQLISARLEKGLSQEQLAKLIGTQRSNICRIESGTQNLTVDMLLKITSALGKDVNFSLEERIEPMSNIYNLKLYNEILLTFSLEEKGLEGLKVGIVYINEEKKSLLTALALKLRDIHADLLVNHYSYGHKNIEDAVKFFYDKTKENKEYTSTQGLMIYLVKQTLIVLKELYNRLGL